MNTIILHPFDPIVTIFFLSLSHLACEANGIHEGATMWLSHFFINKQATAWLNPSIFLKSKSSPKRQKGVTLTTYCKVVSYSLKAYTTDDLVAKAHAEIMKLPQPLNETQIEYDELLWANRLRTIKGTTSTY